MTSYYQSIKDRGGVGWRLRRQPTPPLMIFPELPVIAIRQLAEKQSVVFTGQ